MTARAPGETVERSFDFTGPVGQPLFRYVYEAITPARESTRPYFHPVRTLGGREVTVFRPEDHPWHHGISFTSTDVNGENFWGGATYVPGKDYVELDNQGRIRHDGWEETPHATGFVERLTWLTRTGATLLTERRTLAVVTPRPAEGWYRLDLAFALSNPGKVPAVFSSPGAKGRDSGYGGLFWRGHASFNKGRILAGGGLEGPGVMGKRAPWLAYTTPESWLPICTVAIADDAENPGSPVKWFVREEPYACMAPVFMYDTEWTLAPGATATFRYRVLIADGSPDRGTIELMLAASAAANQ